MPAAPPQTTVDAARLRLALMRLSRRLRQEAVGQITPSQLSALATLDRTGPIPLRTLADAERVGASTLTRIVAALEHQGWITRDTDAADRRVAVARITAAGRRVLSATRDRGTRHLNQRIAQLDDEEVAVLQAAIPVLERLLAEER